VNKDELLKDQLKIMIKKARRSLAAAKRQIEYESGTGTYFFKYVPVPGYIKS